MRNSRRLLREHQPTVERLAAVPGLGVDSAQQIIAEVLTRNVARRSPSIAPSDVPPR
jgi:hypothetical protein